MTAPRFAAAISTHPVASQALGEVTGQILEQLEGAPADLVVCFVSPHFVGAVEDVAQALDRLLHPRALIGATTAAVVGNGLEVEFEPAISVFAGSLPGADLVPFALGAHQALDDSILDALVLDTEPDALVLLTDPYSFPADEFLARVAAAHPGLPALGGLASAASGPGGNRLLSGPTVASGGAVGVFLHGVATRAVVSQGCRPVGSPFAVTRADGNVVYELGGRPALHRLLECAGRAAPDDRELMSRGLQVGIVVDEHKVEFERGDFLVRAVLGADESTGAIAVGDRIDVGATLQFHVRDAAAADEDLRALLGGVVARGALLFTCQARGRGLFGIADHDAAVVQELLGPLPVAGSFCAGEIGPISGTNHLHGFTASMLLFD